VWKLYQWTTEHRNYLIPAISRGPEQLPTITHKEKCKTLRAIFYQEPPFLSISIKADLLCRQDNEIPFEEVTYMLWQPLITRTNNLTSGISSGKFTRELDKEPLLN